MWFSEVVMLAQRHEGDEKCQDEIFSSNILFVVDFSQTFHLLFMRPTYEDVMRDGETAASGQSWTHLRKS